MSPVRYEFDFSASPPFGSQATTEPWTYDGDRFPGASHNVLSSGTYEQPSTVDPSYLAYSGAQSQDFFGTSAPSTTGPSYLTGGLPFHGLDYLRNFDPEGGEQDALGQGFDAGAFRYDPELPFKLPDLPTDQTGQ
jgi:hypothetical protein